MASLNKVQLIGYLGGNPEKKVTTSGTSVVNVSLATTQYYKDSMGQNQSSTEWHRIVLFGTLANNIAQYTQKGSLVYVEGRLQTREWTKDDIRRFTTEVIVERVQFLDKKEKSAGEGHSPSYTAASESQAQSTAGQPPSTQVADDFVEDDIPF